MSQNDGLRVDRVADGSAEEEEKKERTQVVNWRTDTTFGQRTSRAREKLVKSLVDFCNWIADPPLRDVGPGSQALDWISTHNGEIEMVVPRGHWYAVDGGMGVVGHSEDLETLHARMVSAGYRDALFTHRPLHDQPVLHVH